MQLWSVYWEEVCRVRASAENYFVMAKEAELVTHR